jgi:hypothetical protein
MGAKVIFAVTFHGSDRVAIFRLTTLDNRALLEDTRIVLYMTWITWYWRPLRQNQLSFGYSASIELSTCCARLHVRNGASNTLAWLHGPVRDAVTFVLGITACTLCILLEPLLQKKESRQIRTIW